MKGDRAEAGAESNECAKINVLVFASSPTPLGPPVQLVVVPREAAGDGLAEDGDEAQLRAQRQRVRRGDPRRDERAREVVRRRVDKVDARAALRALRRVEEVAVSGEAARRGGDVVGAEVPRRVEEVLLLARGGARELLALEQLEERRRRRLLRAEDHHVRQASVGVAPLGWRGERLQHRRRARRGRAGEEG